MQNSVYAHNSKNKLWLDDLTPDDFLPYKKSKLFSKIMYEPAMTVVEMTFDSL